MKLASELEERSKHKYMAFDNTTMLDVTGAFAGPP
jgi:hypothetical protein